MLWKLSLGLFLCVWQQSHNGRLQSAASFLCLQKQELFFCILSITHFSVANLVCPVSEDVCGNTAFAEVCSPCARVASTVILLSVRTPDFLLCSFYDLARSESLLCPVPTHTPVYVHRPACFVLPLLEVCTFPIYL